MELRWNMIKLVTLKEKHELNIVNKIYDFKNPSKIYIPIYTDTTFKMNDYIYKNTYLPNKLDKPLQPLLHDS